MKKLSAKERKEMVSFYLMRGFTETKTAKNLDVCRQTILRDVNDLKKNARTWIDGLAKDGFILEYKLGLENLKSIRTELWNLSEKTDNHEQKYKILKTISDVTKSYLQLLAEAPTIHAIRKANSEMEKHV